jgi:hypothetical protein
MSKVFAEMDISDFVDSLDLTNENIEKALIEEIRLTGFMIESDYKVNVRVDTGRLRSSMHTAHADYQRHVYSDQKGQMFDGTLKSVPQPDKFTVYNGTNVEYAWKIEVLDQTFEDAFNKNTRDIVQRLERAIK